MSKRQPIQYKYHKNCESCSSQVTTKCCYKKRDKQGGHRICIHDCICNLYLYLYCLLPLFGSSLSAETNFPLQQLGGQSLQEECSYERSFPTWQCLLTSSYRQIYKSILTNPCNNLEKIHVSILKNPLKQLGGQSLQEECSYERSSPAWQCLLTSSYKQCN